MTTTDVPARLAAVVAAQRLRILAGLIRTTGDWELAQDCLQDAVERALRRWPDDGMPDNPAAWLTTAAARRALDALRHRQVGARKLVELATREPAEAPAAPPAGLPDDQLELVFSCCHPALPLPSRVALTLKVVAGLTTRQIAQAFLVSEATVGQRLLRARTRIAHTGIRLRLPPPGRLAERTAGVCAVVYLVFTQGYTTPDTGAGADLAQEAVRLAGLLAGLLPDDGEVRGLHALLLLQHARHRARVDAAGRLVPMDEQDRTRWDRAVLGAGLGELTVARTLGPDGPYRLQAEIAALHATAATAAGTDWAAVVAAHDRLLAAHPSPVFALNRAVAVGFRDGPDAGLAALDGLDLPGYFVLPAARADLLRRAGRWDQSAAAYRQALLLVPTDGEREFLRWRLAQVSGRTADQ